MELSAVHEIPYLCYSESSQNATSGMGSDGPGIATSLAPHLEALIRCQWVSAGAAPRPGLRIQEDDGSAGPGGPGWV